MLIIFPWFNIWKAFNTWKKGGWTTAPEENCSPVRVKVWVRVRVRVRVKVGGNFPGGQLFITFLAVFLVAILCVDIYFSGTKNSYASIKSYESPCSPDYILTKNMVLDCLISMLLTIRVAPIKAYFQYFDIGRKTLQKLHYTCLCMGTFSHIYTQLLYLVFNKKRFFENNNILYFQN